MCRYRLAFAVVRYFPFGGMQRNLLRIARVCAARGHDVHVLSSAWSGPRPDDLTIHILDVNAWTNHGLNEKFGAVLHDAVTHEDFDCVVGSNRTRDLHVYYAGDPCYAARFHETKPAVYALLPRYQSFLRQESEVFGPHVDTDILLPAHCEQPKFIRYYGTATERFHLLPPGVDRERLLARTPDAAERVELREALGIGADDLMLLSVGSAFRTKGVHRTIRAMASLPEDVRRRTHLVVVGNGKAASLTRLARRLGVGQQVRFTGPREDLVRFYHSADLLVHAAVLENTGNAIIEAMVCGLPVLATANCGYAFHVEEATAGRICPTPFEQRELDRLLTEMLSDPDRDRWRSGAWEYCDKVDLYTLSDRAADAVIDRARRNRSAPAPVAALH